MRNWVGALLVAVAGLLAQQAAFGYAATAEVTFTWANGGTARGWTYQGTNVLPAMSNDTWFTSLGGNNSVSYYNSDFAAASDYDPGTTGDDCLTPVEGYETIQLRKYGCRVGDDEGYYTQFFVTTPATGSGPGGAASGTLTVTDTTLTGTLNVVATTDLPTGGTANSAGNGASGYNVRTADGSPFGNAWYGVSTAATLTVNLTGTFTATGWQIDGGTVRLEDPSFQCQQGGVGGSGTILCATSVIMGGNGPLGSTLSWGVDLDGGGPGTTMAPIEVRNSAGTAVVARLSGVLASLALDPAGNISTVQGEYRSGLGAATASCPDHLRWDGGRLSCGTFTSSDLVITGVATPDEADDTVPDAFAFDDLAGVSLAATIVSGTLTPTGFNVPTTVSVTGGEYSIGCAAGGFTTAAGTLDPGDTVCVRHQSSASSFTTTDTVLEIGGVTDTFSSTTGDQDLVPDPFAFPSRTGVMPSQFIISEPVVITGITGPAAVSVSNGYHSVGCTYSFTVLPGTIEPGQSICVAHNSTGLPGTQTVTTVTIGGVPGTFTSTTYGTPPPQGEVTYAITGSMDGVVNQCFNIAVALTGADCSYARTRFPVPAAWQGPSFIGAFYPRGGAGDQLGYAPVPGDGKMSPPLTGTVTIDDNGTAADGTDDRISARWVFGAAAFNAITGNGDSALERWDEWAHDMPPTAVSSATPLANGGWRYVIGSRGRPTPPRLCAAGNPADCFPSENAGTFLSTAGFWDATVPESTPADARVGIERSPGFGYAGPGQPLAPNVGGQTSATLAGYECVDSDGDNDCLASETLIGPGTTPGSAASPPGFENVVLVVETDGLGSITSAEAYWTREYVIAFGPSIGDDPAGTYATPNAWGGGRFSFTGAAGDGVVPRAQNDEATVPVGGVVSIPVLENDTGLDNGPISLRVWFTPRFGYAYASGDQIYYHPNVNYSVQDYLQYRIVDARGNASFAIVRIDIVAPVGPDANEDYSASFGDQPETIDVLGNDERVGGNPLTVTISRPPADGTAEVTGSPGAADGIRVVYRAASRNPTGSDSFEYRVTDADGYSDVATVRMSRYPNIAQDDTLTVTSGETGVLYPLSNDYLPYEAPLYGIFGAGVYVNPQHGTVRVFDSPGYPYGIRFEYTPYPGYTGEDSFEYAVDNERRFSIGTVRVTVVADADRDGIVDGEDNCTLKANPDQRDTDGDGYGNVCDADLNNSGFVNMTDLALFRQKFGTNDPHADFNGSGFVNYADLGILSVGFGKPPGPSGTVD